MAELYKLANDIINIRLESEQSSSPTQSNAKTSNHHLVTFFDDLVVYTVLKTYQHRRRNGIACFGQIYIKLFLGKRANSPDSIEHELVGLMENEIVYFLFFYPIL